MRRRLVIAALVILATVAAAAGILVHRFVDDRARPAPPAPPDPLAALRNTREVEITITTPDWKKRSLTVTVDRLRTDRNLWRQMHFNDWDKVPEPLRESVLRLMLLSYARVLEGPGVWRGMTPAEWDYIPQPIRAMAYLRMIWHWARIEDLGAEFGLDPEVLAQSVAGIVMQESWFQHRAVNQNEWGNRDLGLAQCSDYCREEIAAMAEDGDIAFAPDESDYFNPWVATRVATVWFERELLKAEGDVELAIRAYHRGIDNAFDEKGDVYHERVRRLRERYIRTQTASPSWRFLAREIARRASSS